MDSLPNQQFFSSWCEMPAVKFRSIRRKKRRPPSRQKKVAGSTEASSTASTGLGVPVNPGSSPSTTPPLFSSPSSSPSPPPNQQDSSSATQVAIPETPPEQRGAGSSVSRVGSSPGESETVAVRNVSEKKLKLSQGSILDGTGMCEGEGVRLFEISGLQRALLEGTRCIRCKRGRVVLQENLKKRHGLYTSPYILCRKCKHITPIAYAKTGKEGRAFALNLKSILASKCSGQNYNGLRMFFAMLGLPLPVTKNVYTGYVREIREKSIVLANKSMLQAREEVRNLIDSPGDDIVDIIVSADGTWQKRGFKSLFGAAFIISNETGKVLDYRVKSKHCKGCLHWEKKDKTSREYKEWKEGHKCECNFDGSAGSMEPKSILQMFKSSLQFKIRYSSLICDGDAKTHAMILDEQPYGEGHLVVKLDCIGHIQKRMGNALRRLKETYRGQKLSDGKTIGGQGRLTESLINSLQNYYGDAIRGHKGDVKAMMKGVQATLLHCNSTDERPRHNLCPEGVDSWCKYNRAKAKGESFTHKRPIPPAIVPLLRPMYARLGSRELLEKCVDGYTQNANEALHNIVWRLCPKGLFLYKVGVDIACALAVASYNDGSRSLSDLVDLLKLEPTQSTRGFLCKKDLKRVKEASYKMGLRARKLRRAHRRKRKGLDDKHAAHEGDMYVPGGFDAGEPAPKRAKRATKD